MFRFLLTYFSSHDTPERVVTYKTPSSKINIPLMGERAVYTIPDVTIAEENTLIFLEADTGLEGSSKIYNKILKYIYISINGQNEIDKDILQIYFSFPAKSRITDLFGSNGKVFPYFQEYSNKLMISRNYGITIDTENILKVFNAGRLSIFAGSVHDSWNEYRKIDFVNLLENVNNDLGIYNFGI